MGRFIHEFKFRSEVRAVKLRLDHIVVVLEHKIYVYNFTDFKLLHQIETLGKPQGALLPFTQLEYICLGLPRSPTRAGSN